MRTLIRQTGLWTVLMLLTALGATAQAPTRFEVTVEQVGVAYPYVKSGVFNTPVGADEPAPIGPGAAYEFSFTAGPGQRLSLATMFVQSNDLFYAFDPEGLPLYDDSGMPVSGDVTDQLALWDAGTEVDQEPGVGEDQAPRQSAPDTGADEDGVIVRIGDGGTNDGYAYPTNSEVIQLTITNDGATGFTVRIENVSTEMTLDTSEGSVAVPLSPGGWAVHGPDATFFTTAEAASDGLEAIAEDGDPSVLAEALTAGTGLTVPLSPLAFAIHPETVTFFDDGGAAGAGIEAIAEDGDPSAQVMALAGLPELRSFGAVNTPAGAEMPAPIGPGGAYTFQFTALPGDHLSLATMFVQSNDLFYAFEPEGLALFDGNGAPMTGDMTGELALWDAGTEVDQEPGVGADQAPRQSGPDTGTDEDGVIVRIGDGGTNDGYTYPMNAEVIRVTVTPVETTPFVVRIENVSTEATLMTSEGSVAVPLSPGAFAVHTDAVAFFAPGEAAGAGIEAIAEDGDPTAQADALRGLTGVVQRGAFNTPVGADAPAPIGPGGTYEFDLEAAPGDRLSLATMFVQSNDLFYAFDPEGLALFDGSGAPMTGDMTAELALWDAGTEVDQEPGVGADQAPRQSGPDTGADEDGVIVRIGNGGTNDGYTYPVNSEVLRITLLSGTRTDVEPEGEELPAAFELLGNYPNPFNPSTEIRYALAEPAPVRLAVYNLLGQQVVELVSGPQAAGTYRVRWNGTDAQGRVLPSGVYLYRLTAAGQQQARTMVLLK